MKIFIQFNIQSHSLILYANKVNQRVLNSSRDDLMQDKV